MAETKVPIITQIQNELHAPKNQYNSFGKYKYRSAEDIEQALKPLLAKYNASLMIDEEVKPLGNRSVNAETNKNNGVTKTLTSGNKFYVVETLHYKDAEQEITVKGWAREADKKKGMDESQITGTASSYATKRALCNLFLIDDTKDSDATNNGPQSNTGRTATHKAPAKKTESISERIKKAKSFEVQYGGGKEKLIDIIALQNKGDEQAKLFLDGWRQKSSKNENAYQFLLKIGG